MKSREAVEGLSPAGGGDLFSTTSGGNCLKTNIIVVAPPCIIDVESYPITRWGHTLSRPVSFVSPSYNCPLQPWIIYRPQAALLVTLIRSRHSNLKLSRGNKNAIEKLSPEFEWQVARGMMGFQLKIQLSSLEVLSEIT